MGLEISTQSLTHSYVSSFWIVKLPAGNAEHTAPRMHFTTRNKVPYKFTTFYTKQDSIFLFILFIHYLHFQL